ncbi:MAG TPA: nitroreductase [Chloroflexi bacterium]|nr:nitroreductase [Chloroflexota bacterium]
MSKVFLIENNLKSRRSIRRYLTDSVCNKILFRLLESATWAPSAHNRQPWRFVVIKQNSKKEDLAYAMGDRLRADRSKDGDNMEIIEKDVTRSINLIVNSPVVIIVCYSMIDMDKYSDESRSYAEKIMAIQSTAMAVQNLMLAAHAEGLSTCWRCAPLFCADTVVNILDLPEDWNPQALITMGYPNETPKVPTRLNLSEVTEWM